MVIPVLPSLNTQQQWMAFCHRKVAYCFVESPESLVDFQSSFLKITLLTKDPRGQDSVKYSLGSKNSMEPAWRLIKACNWDLAAIIKGVEAMNFDGNVRDNSLLKAHTDLSARKFFSRERGIVAPETLGVLDPLNAVPELWNSHNLSRMISNGQYKAVQSEIKAIATENTFGMSPAPDKEEICMVLLDPEIQCIGQQHKGRLHIYRDKQPYVSLIPNLIWPQPRLIDSNRA